MSSYSAFTQRVRDEAEIRADDAKFTAQWPAMLLDAETRLLRDLDPLVARKYLQTTFSLVPAVLGRLGTPPELLVVRELGFFTPAGTTTKYNPIDRKTEGFIKDYWLDRSITGLPKFFCELAHNQVLVAPSPNAAYTVEIAGTYRVASLAVASPNDGTQTTYLSTFHGDLLFAASMVQVAGFKKNYGAMADDPASAMSWEAIYQRLLPGAQMEEGRRKSGSYADESKTQPPERNAVQ
jgi:hypothetical protein